MNNSDGLPTAAEIAEAAEQIRQGNLVAFPTETVYGLGANAFDAFAVAKVFALKQRPRFDPLIVHICEAAQLRTLVRSIPDAAQRLLEAFWPGPLTFVLPKQDCVPDLVTSNLPDVAVRMPDHAVSREFIQQAGVPVAAPSANRFGKISPTTAAHVRDSFGDDTPMLLDAGPCRVGVESTVIAFPAGQPTILRPGGVSREQIEACIGPVDLSSARADQATMLPPSASPGQLASHYAPHTPLHLVDDPFDLPSLTTNERWGLLCLTPPADTSAFAAVEILSATGDLREAATNLFAALRRLDAQQLAGIVATRLPTHGLGLAIMDRLQRASRR